MSLHLVLEIWVDLTHKKTTFMNEFQKLNLRKLSIFVVDPPKHRQTYTNCILSQNHQYL